VRLAEHPAAVDGERGSCPGFYSLLAGRQGKIKRLARPLERLRDGHPADLSRGHLGEYEIAAFQRRKTVRGWPCEVDAAPLRGRAARLI